jgi:hypothetical protein
MSTHHDDPEIWNRARAALPMPQLAEKLGRGLWMQPKIRCPKCDAKPGKWEVKNRNGRWFFKCWMPSCEAHDPAGGHGEIGFLAMVEGISVKDACCEYLKLAVPAEVPHLMDAPEGPKEPGKSHLLQSPTARPKAQRKPENPWDELVQKLPLTASDAERLLKKRGLSPESQELFCLRSNNPSNRAIVAGLSKTNGGDWPEDELIELGIFKHKRGQPPYPRGQLCGWGRTGKWRIGGDKSAGEDDEEIWSEEVQPVLIPYFDPKGVPFYLRPHKGGITNKDNEIYQEEEQIYLDDADDDNERECAAHAWFPPNFRELLELSDGVAILTEGEFKAQAICQCLIAGCATPGISFIRNPAFKQELIRALSIYGVRELIIIFDNEVKDDPKFPNYKADPEKRCDTEVWAEFTMHELRPYFRNIGGSVLVGQLPHEWEIRAGIKESLRVDGKADFDGILAKCVGELGLKDGTKKARAVFRSTMEKASGQPNRDLFESRKRKIIERRIHMKYVKRRVLFGRWGKKDGKERKLCEAFSEWDEEAGEPVDQPMANKLRAVRGCYYVWKNTPPHSTKDEPPPGTQEFIRNVEIPAIQGKIEAAKSLPNNDAKQQRIRILKSRLSSLFYRLKGFPEPISTCVIRGEFKLHTPGGETCRMVRIYDSRATGRGKQPPLRKFSPGNCKSAGELQVWLQGTGEGDYLGGKTEADKIVADLNDEVFERDIHAVTSVAFHTDTRCWFFGDVAYLDDLSNKAGMSTELLPDENGVFWIDGTGYNLDAQADDSGQSTFTLGLPMLRQVQGIKTLDLFGNGDIGDLLQTRIYEASRNPRLAPHCDPVLKLMLAMAQGGEKQSLESILAACATADVTVENPVRQKGETAAQMEVMPFRDWVERELVTVIFEAMASALRETIGDYDAWAAIGGTLAFALGPELVSEYHCHPGVWLSGPFGSGKSETALMLCRMMGMKDQAIKLIKSLTPVGMARALFQYSSWPINFDEYRRLMEDLEAREHIMRGSTERGVSTKGTITSATSTRTLQQRTSPIVSGEHSSEDPATRSRFLHISVNEARRRAGSPAAWEMLKAWRPHFYHIGRWVMKRRRAFASATLANIADWIGDAAVKETTKKDRIRLSAGVGYSAFNAISVMLGLFAEQRDDFKKCMLKIMADASTNATEETFRNQFWREVLSGLGRPTSGIKRSFFSLRHVWIKKEDKLLDAIAIPTFGGTPEPGQPASAGEFVKRLLTENKHYKLAVLTETEKACYPNALPVMFMAHSEVFAEYQRDSGSKRETIKIGITDLRDECEKEPWFIPGPSGRHRQKLGENNATTGCWCIALDTFPFAEEFCDKLENTGSPQ